MPPELTSETDLASQILVIVGQKADARLPSFTSEELFNQATRKQLLDCAQTLGLTGVSKLMKEDLAVRVKVAFDGLRAAIARSASAAANGSTPAAENGMASFPPKFDLGPAVDAAPMPQHIPWGYGYDRVTAMVIDPERLFVYWEVTDDAVAAARAGLGPAGANAWLNLRVYDITGRLFDGTNAHSYFDHRIERSDRQWFFVINKPTSSACVEVGLKSEEGYFAKVVRSGRAEFPRREPMPGGAVEWLTVRASGEIQGHHHGASPSNGVAAGGTEAGAAGAHGGGPGPGGESPSWADWTEHFGGFPAPGGNRAVGRRWEWQEQSGAEWTGDVKRTEWVGPASCVTEVGIRVRSPIHDRGPLVGGGVRDSGEISGADREPGRDARRLRPLAGGHPRTRRGAPKARGACSAPGSTSARCRSRVVSEQDRRGALESGQVGPGSSEWMS